MWVLIVSAESNLTKRPHRRRTRMVVAIFYNGPTFPHSKLPLPIGNLDLHLIHGFLGPPEFTTQATSRSVQPFLQGSRLWQTDRPTDHATRSCVTVGRIYQGRQRRGDGGDVSPPNNLIGMLCAISPQYFVDFVVRALTNNEQNRLETMLLLSPPLQTSIHCVLLHLASWLHFT